ncbi:sulfotransferase [Marinobacter sp.]|uniref:sulfotransferase n=1 Tax=Marinobacter sp. TaxID=50741 RepID=UPI00384EAD89
MPSNPPLNVLVCGIYRSGSSAIVDYLKGHPECSAAPGEFTEFKREGRIGSMLTAGAPEEALKIARRMRLETLFARLPRAWLTQRRKSGSRALKYRVDQNLLKLEHLKKYSDDLRRGAAPASTSHMNRWIQETGKRVAGDRDILVWNQPVWIGAHHEVWPEVFEPFRFVGVHRDPIDQFADIVRQGTLGKPKTDPLYEGNGYQQDPIDYLFTGLTRKLESLLELKKQLPEDRFLAMPFEWFVQDHDKAKNVLCNFIGVEPGQVSKPRFDPAQSKGNIGIGHTDEIKEQLAPYQQQLDRMAQIRRQLWPTLD